MKPIFFAALTASFALLAPMLPAQQNPPSGAPQSRIAKAGPKPMIFDTWTPGSCSPNGQPHGGCPAGTLHRIRVTPVATGLARPWHMAFLPDGKTMLVTELAGRLRAIRDGVLDPKPVAGWPPADLQAKTLHSVIVHPQFTQNHLLFLSYEKADNQGRTTMALARAKYESSGLSEVRDVFVADAWEAGGAIAGRATFGPDGMIYLAVGDRDRAVVSDDPKYRMKAQDLMSDIGKVLRVREDGSIPPDNPFVGRADAKPEIFTYGHRNVYGLAWHPDNGTLYEVEIGPMGGDELNILIPGHNYGWPLVSFGRIYSGNVASEQPYFRPGMDSPVMFWVPAITPSSLIIYTGDRFPWWKGHLFIGALSGQQLLRVAFNQPSPQEERRESLLTQLDRRIRDVRQGPDGLIYVATERALDQKPGEVGPAKMDEGPSGSVLRIEPVE